MKHLHLFLTAVLAACLFTSCQSSNFFAGEIWGGPVTDPEFLGYYSNKPEQKINSTNPQDYIISHDLAWGVPSIQSFNMIISPWKPFDGFIFVGPYRPGDLIRDPYSKKLLVVPDRKYIAPQRFIGQQE